MRTYRKILSSFFFAAALFLLPGIELASGAPVPGIDITYTSDADFDKGTLLNLDHNGAHDQLQLSDTTTPFPFIYIANSNRGTIVRIDVNTGTILGEYYTSPNGMGRNPSRTTVDQFGNVWVSNRDEGGVSGGKSKGSIARVGLIIGGTRANADGSANPTGQYLRPPFQYNTCSDRNGDGLIKTSRATDNRLSWTNAGGADTHGGVSTAEDECIINYTRVAATNTRTVAIDANNDVWVGGANMVHEKVSGLTGQTITGTEFNLGCGGYGGLIDKNGVLWSARYGAGLLRFDTKTMTGACLGNSRGDYGLAVDPNTGEIWHTFLYGNKVARLAPSGTLLGIYNHGADNAQGVVVDKSGNVWVAHSLWRSSVGHLRTNGTFVGTVSTGSGPTGVAVDANGKVWSTNYYAWTASRIDPNAGAVGGGGFKKGAVDKTVNLGTSAYPYNYSDMTGYVAIGGTSPQGSWSVVQDSGAAANKWGAIAWNKEPEGKLPVGAIILVEARTSDTEAGLGSKSFTAVSDNQPFSLMGRYIEVRVTLKPNSSGEKPVLSDLRIRTAPISNVRVIDTISAGDIVIDPNSFTHQPYSITSDSDRSVIEWRFDAFSIGEIQDLAYTVSMKNPVPGEDRLVSHKLEVLYTDLDGNSVRKELGSQFVHVLNSKYASALTTDKQSYGAKEDAVISAGITNLSQFARTLEAKIAIEDSGGAEVQEVVVLSEVQLAAGETKNFNNLVFNTGSNYAGAYRARLLLYDGPNQVGTSSADFTISPAIAVSSSVVTDKVDYQPNEQATLTATVTSQSLNYVMENLAAKVTISSLDPAGNVQLYTGTKEIPILIQGGSSTFKTYWNTGTNPAGTYLVTLEILDAAGAVLSTSTRDLVISSTTKPAALLKGQISLDNNSILSGDPVTVSYSVTNSGNLDLSDIELFVRTVDLMEETEYNTISDQTTLSMGATYTKSRQLDTRGYSAKDYLVVLQARIAGVEEILAGTYFRVRDETPPELIVNSPIEGETYRADISFSVRSIDTVSGVDRVEYRLDEQESWSVLTLSDSSTDTYLGWWETTYEDDGQHTLVVRAVDKAGNQAISVPVTFKVLNDVTPPETRLEIGEPYFSKPDGSVYVTAETSFTLVATDDLSGVQTTYYRFDEEPDWRVYYGAFRVGDLGFGPHTIYFRAVDHSGNQETEKFAGVTLIGIEVDTEILNRPRVLVWTQDPEKSGGKDRQELIIDDVENFLSTAFVGQDVYFQLVTEKDAFQAAFRSGIYNVVMVLDQDVPFDAGFLREMREAVYQGTGLLFSSWGNSVHPILQEMFGVDFRGSLAMDESERILRLYDSPLSAGQMLFARGRVLRTALASGTLAGIIPGESACAGIKSLSLSYPLEIRQGDRVTVSLSVPQGKRLVLIDEEQLTVEDLPAVPNNNLGPPDGDIAISGITADGVSLSLSAPYGYLGESYSLSMRVERPDGTLAATGPVPIVPTCTADLRPGAAVGLFLVVAVDEDRVRTTEDTPAVVLSEYGEGRAIFLAYDIVGSSASDVPGHSALLRNTATWLLPPFTGPHAAKIALLHTTIRPHGAAVELKAEDIVGEGMLHRPLFGLMRLPLEYRFSLRADEEASYRYFVEFSEEWVEYGKMTRVFLHLDDDYPWFWFDDYPLSFKIDGGFTLLSP